MMLPGFAKRGPQGNVIGIYQDVNHKYVMEDASPRQLRQQAAATMQLDAEKKLARMKSITGLKDSPQRRNSEKIERQQNKKSHEIIEMIKDERTKREAAEIKMRQSKVVVQAAVKFKNNWLKGREKKAEVDKVERPQHEKDRLYDLAPKTQVAPKEIFQIIRRASCSKSEIGNIWDKQRNADQAGPKKPITFKTLAKIQIRLPKKLLPRRGSIQESVNLTNGQDTRAGFRIRYQNVGDARAHFVRCARRVLIVLKWMSILEEAGQKWESEMKTFFDLASEIETSTRQETIQEKTGLFFDPNYFKALKMTNFTQETRSTLTLDQNYRTEEMLQKALLELQTIGAFSEYPMHMQKKLVQVAWYQEVEPNKRILQEGHPGFNFYFIITGQVLVKKMIRNEETGCVRMTVLGRLKEGHSFGEVALVSASKRTATVETTTLTRLLVISREAFNSIFLVSKAGDLPEHLKYLRDNVPVLRKWPIPKLLEHPGAHMFLFCRRGTVVVKDSHHNEFLYIVKSGTCSVLKRLVQVKPKLQRHIHPDDCITTKLQHFIAPSLQGQKYRTEVNPGLQRAMTDFFETQRRTPTDLPGGSATCRPTIRINSGDSERSPRETGRGTSAGGTGGAVGYSRSRFDNILPQLYKRTSLPNTKAIQRSQTFVANQGERRNKVTRSSSSAGSSLTMKVTLGCATDHVVNTIPDREGSHSDSTKTSNVAKKIQSVGPAIQNANPKEASTADMPCFIRLKKMEAGQIFGLEDMSFDQDALDEERTVVSLVSDGAELVMIEKKTFQRYLDVHSQQDIMESLRRFPDPQVLQSNLQREVDWKLYREDVVRDHVQWQTLLGNL